MQIRVDWSADAANKAGTEKLGRRCRIRVAWSADAANKAGTEKLGSRSRQQLMETAAALPSCQFSTNVLYCVMYCKSLFLLI